MAAQISLYTLSSVLCVNIFLILITFHTNWIYFNVLFHLLLIYKNYFNFFVPTLLYVFVMLYNSD